MPTVERFKAKIQGKKNQYHAGVYYIIGQAVSTGKPEKIYYIRYRQNGKQVEEKAGRQYQDDMTAAKAARIRASRIEGKQLSNSQRREAAEAEKKADADRWTISKLWDAYKENRPDLKGIVTDENRYQKYIRPNFGAREPADLIPLDVDRLRLKLLKTKAPGTVKNVLELLRRIVNFGSKKNLCPGLQFKIEMPKVNSEKTEDLTADQLKALLKAIEKDTNVMAGNMMRMALYTGMRRNEMFKLKWSDINFDRGVIHIRDPKGGQDQNIPLNDAARELLKGHPRSRSPYVFPGRKGRQRTDIKHQVNRIKDAAGLPKSFRALHGLRHVYASMLASSGQVDMYTLQKLLTHKSPIMTQRYAHLRDEALRRASDLAGSIITEATNGAKNDDEKVVNLKDHSS